MFSEKTRIIGAGAIGNVLEWFDFAIYGYFAITIGQTFFPHQDPVAQLLSTFGVFAIGCLMRPLGSLLSGSIGDRYGRRFMFVFEMAVLALFLEQEAAQPLGIAPGNGAVGMKLGPDPGEMQVIAAVGSMREQAEPDAFPTEIGQLQGKRSGLALVDEDPVCP